MKQKILAIVGMPGSGKTEAIEYFQKKYKLPKVYFGEVTFDELHKRGLEINEKNERMVREELRKKFGNNIYSTRMIKKIKNLSSKENILVESLYSWPEYMAFKKKFKNQFIIIAIYSSPNTRYERLAKRKIRPLKKEEVQSRDYAQIENLSQGGPIAIADYTIVNEGTKKELVENLNKIWRRINAK